MATSPYIGRFAPSPTGPLHKGSLLAALASYLDARTNQGQWLVRIEDIDPPREVSGAADKILTQLEAHGLHWDGPVLYQSSRLSDYRDALQQLKRANLLFDCYCSRAKLTSTGKHCKGSCKELKIQTSAHVAPKAPNHSIRIHTPLQSQHAQKDLIQSNFVFNPGLEGDFILWRRDQLPAYQLATSLDDSYQNISRVIRGNDLIDSTARQIYALRCLNLKVPEYGHIPVLTNQQGQKLSKQNHAPELNSAHASENLRICLNFLGLPSPAEFAQTPPASILTWATAHWKLGLVPKQAAVAESDKPV